MNHLLDAVGNNLLPLPLNAYLISKKILPEKGLWVHVMKEVVSIALYDIYFNKLWEWFSDQ